VEGIGRAGFFSTGIFPGFLFCFEKFCEIFRKIKNLNDFFVVTIFSKMFLGFSRTGKFSRDIFWPGAVIVILCRAPGPGLQIPLTVTVGENPFSERKGGEGG
jgi:hypothetical protein